MWFEIPVCIHEGFFVLESYKKMFHHKGAQRFLSGSFADMSGGAVAPLLRVRYGKAGVFPPERNPLSGSLPICRITVCCGKVNPADLTDHPSLIFHMSQKNFVGRVDPASYRHTNGKT
jgi:hypothetical protein